MAARFHAAVFCSGPFCSLLKKNSWERRLLAADDKSPRLPSRLLGFFRGGFILGPVRVFQPVAAAGRTSNGQIRLRTEPGPLARPRSGSRWS